MGKRKMGKIPLGPVIGGLVSLYMAGSKIARFAGDTGYATPGDALNDLAMATIGLSKNAETGKMSFSWDTLGKGLLPDLLPFAIGTGAHIVAQKTGANRAISKIPWVQI